MSFRTKSQRSTDVSGIDALVSSDGKINKAELQQVLNNYNDSLAGMGESFTYTSSVPFDKAYQYASVSMSADIAFTVNSTGALAGAATLIKVTADGTHNVSFTGFNKSSGSLPFDNTNAVVNHIYFWCDGSLYWYSIDRAA